MKIKFFELRPEDASWLFEHLAKVPGHSLPGDSVAKD